MMRQVGSRWSGVLLMSSLCFDPLSFFNSSVNSSIIRHIMLKLSLLLEQIQCSSAYVGFFCLRCDLILA